MAFLNALNFLLLRWAGLKAAPELMSVLGRSEMMGDVGELQELHSEAACHPELQNKAFPTHCKVVSNTGTYWSSKDYVLF